MAGGRLEEYSYNVSAGSAHEGSEGFHRQVPIQHEHFDGSQVICQSICIQAVQLMHYSRVRDSYQQITTLIVNSIVHGRPVLVMVLVIIIVATHDLDEGGVDASTATVFE